MRFLFPSSPLGLPLEIKDTPADTCVACCVPMFLQRNVSFTCPAISYASLILHHIKLQYDYLVAPLSDPDGD
jgi:hypothetical protein